MLIYKYVWLILLIIILISTIIYLYKSKILKNFEFFKQKDKPNIYILRKEIINNLINQI